MKPQSKLLKLVLEFKIKCIIGILSHISPIKKKKHFLDKIEKLWP